MMKKIFLLLPILLFSGCGFFNQIKIENKPVPTSTIVSVATTSSVDVLTLVDETSSTEALSINQLVPYTFTLASIKQNWQGPTTTVELSYPVMNYPQHPELAESFNQAARKTAQTRVDNFLQGIVKDWPDMKDSYSEGMSNDISVSLGDIFVTPSLVLSEYEMSYYTAGAAHPNFNTESFNFDLDAGKKLLLEDLFLPKSNYIKKLSQLSEVELLQTGDSNEDWIREVAGPKAENFHTVTLGADGLHIKFDPYDIDSYAAGPSEITIPYKKLPGFIRPEFVQK